ncbi:MAG: hypothetical protein HC852_00960 [Acaryochloridaceae cyanobacterium RU_4_10]|nr:hypothetical protein [Acaryochloridaceae cyanobacterium RU_4_10]
MFSSKDLTIRADIAPFDSAQGAISSWLSGAEASGKLFPRNHLMSLMCTLSQIAEQAVAATADDPDGGLKIDELYRLLDVSGTQNKHIANRLNRDPNVYYFRPRESPLTGDEPIYGQFLSLAYGSHDPYALLQDYDNLALLEASILSDGGFVNPFTTFLIAFIDFRAVSYEITYRSRNNPVVLFNKQNQYDGSDSVREEYKERQLQWQR